MKKVFFVVANKSVGSAVMSGFQIRDGLKSLDVDCEVVTPSEIDLTIKNSIFVWVKEANIRVLQSLTGNSHFYTPVDSLCFNLGHSRFLDTNLFDGFFINNSLMRDNLLNFISSDKLHVVPQHWDPRYGERTLTNNEDVVFGYIGSVASLYISDNLKFHKELANEKGVVFVDTERGVDMTDLVKQGTSIGGKFNPEAILSAPIPFNCHMSVRSINGSTYNYKPATKLATAASLGHNIITTDDISVRDVLPKEYPFILKSHSYESICEMMDTVRSDFYSNKSLWNLGLSIMKDVKQRLSLGEISKQYKSVLELY